MVNSKPLPAFPTADGDKERDRKGNVVFVPLNASPKDKNLAIVFFCNFTEVVCILEMFVELCFQSCLG
jgi:hypothetical protein